MATILQFPRSRTSFGPETLSTLGEAYDAAFANVRDKQPPEVICGIIASRIIAAAMQGECNPDRLCEVALRDFL